MIRVFIAARLEQIITHHGVTGVIKHNMKRIKTKNKWLDLCLTQWSLHLNKFRNFKFVHIITSEIDRVHNNQRFWGYIKYRNKVEIAKFIHTEHFPIFILLRQKTILITCNFYICICNSQNVLRYSIFMLVPMAPLDMYAAKKSRISYLQKLHGKWY